MCLHCDGNTLCVGRPLEAPSAGLVRVWSDGSDAVCLRTYFSFLQPVLTGQVTCQGTSSGLSCIFASSQVPPEAQRGPHWIPHLTNSNGSSKSHCRTEVQLPQLQSQVLEAGPQLTSMNPSTCGYVRIGNNDYGWIKKQNRNFSNLSVILQH